MRIATQDSRRRRFLTEQAFTLIELLIVVAIIGLLAGMLLPTLASAKEKARALICLNNKKQLQLAWHLYAVDHQGKLVPNGWNVPSPPQPELGLWWAQGYLDYDGGNSENTNILLLLDPEYAKLGPYTQNPKIYKCPSDRSQVKIGKRRYDRVRSTSMNALMAGIAKCGKDDVPAGSQREDAIRVPNMRFVFIDENPDSIDFTTFHVTRSEGVMTMRDWQLQSLIFSFPGGLHQRAATLSFADGHVELHRWEDARTVPAVTYSTRITAGVSSPNNSDMRWLAERTFEE